MKLLLAMTNQPVNFHSTLPTLALSPHKKADQRRIQLGVLHCIHESMQKQAFVQIKPQTLQNNIVQISFSHYRLSPFDCTVIGAFLSQVLNCSTGTCSSELHVGFDNCKIGDHGVQILLQPILDHKPSSAVTRSKPYSKFSLGLAGNDITCASVQKLKQLFTLPFIPSTRLHLLNNFTHSKQTSISFLNT